MLSLQLYYVIYLNAKQIWARLEWGIAYKN